MFPILNLENEDLRAESPCIDSDLFFGMSVVM